MLKRLGLIAVVLLALAGAALAQEDPPPAVIGPTLNSVLSRGVVACGLNQNLRGFGFLDPNTGELRGFDVDLCRALAAAVFGDATAAQLVPFSGDSGLNALESGEIDVLLRNVVWTLSLDSRPRLDFGTITFYTGQTFITRVDSSLSNWDDLDGGVICIVEGSTAAASLGQAMAVRGLSYQPVTLPTAAEAVQALTDGRCQAYSAGLIDLEAARQRLTDPAAYTVWQGREHLYTQEPIAPVYRSDDPQWADIVNWTILGLIQAEQLGITSENINTIIRQPNEGEEAYINRVGADVARFLDAKTGVGGQLTLANDFMVNVIREVGSYGEIYNRHFGPGGELRLERDLNSLWRDGGLLYAPSWR